MSLPSMIQVTRTLAFVRGIWFDEYLNAWGDGLDDHAGACNTAE